MTSMVELEWTWSEVDNSQVAASARWPDVTWIVGLDTDGLWCVESVNAPEPDGEVYGKFWGAFPGEHGAKARAQEIENEYLKYS